MKRRIDAQKLPKIPFLFMDALKSHIITLKIEDSSFIPGTIKHLRETSDRNIAHLHNSSMSKGQKGMTTADFEGLMSRENVSVLKALRNHN